MGWRKASVPKKNTPMLMRAAVLADQNEIPDNHVLTVRDRVLSTDLQRIVQNNVKTDTVTLDLDGEWDDCASIFVTFNDETAQSGPWSLEWKGQPLTIPSAIGAVVGPVPVSVVGYGSDGELRLVTEAAPQLLNVVKSGYVEIVDDNEENKDILSQMVAAGQAAEDAAEAANAAATSANSATTKANSAASSASSAASSANSAATKANSAAVDAQNAYDTLQPYMATIDSCANILHREVGPDAVVTADDSFPCKPVEMVVYGNTVQNLWANPRGTVNGITITSNEDGSITLSGTMNSSTSTIQVQSYALKPSTQYTFSVDKEILGGNTAFVLVQFDESGQTTGSNRIIGKDGSTSDTFTTQSNMSSVRMQVYCNRQDTTVSGTYRVMLNEGSEAQPWCPPGLNSVGDGGSVEVVTAGKNLFVSRDEAKTASGITVTPNGDGSYTVDGTSTALCQFIFRQYKLIPDGGFVLSGGAKDVACAAWFYDIGGKYIGGAYSFSDSGTSQDETVRKNARYYTTLIEVLKGKTISNKVVWPMMRRYGTAADYEPPNITTTTIDLQGHTLNSLPDGTRDELHIDGGGNVVLEKRVGDRVVDGTNLVAVDLFNDGKEARVPIGDSYFVQSSGDESDKILSDKLPSYDPDVLWTTKPRNGCAVAPSNQIAARCNDMSTVSAFNQYFQQNNMRVVYKLAEPQTIDLGTITPPTMAAPNVTAYVADDTPAEMTLDYVRDVNIVHSRLEERVAALELASATS